MPTIKDIARECGVSANTVSSVLNNKPGQVSPQTRDRIMDAIRRLGYRPSAAARRMLGKRMNTIGIADRYTRHTEPDSYKAQILEPLSYTARSLRWDVLYYSGHATEGGFPAFLDGRSDGLISFTGWIDPAEVKAIMNAGVPVIFIGVTEVDQAEHQGAVLDVDNESGGYLATNHLIELGHRRIGLISAPDISGSIDRESGYRRAFKEAGIPVDEGLIFPHYDWSDLEFEERAIVSRGHDRPTAIFCFNDHLAFNVLRAASKLGVDVPGELSVVGFDDIIPSALSKPPLTTVHQPLALIGQRAVEIIVAIIEGTLPGDYREIVEPKLIVRESTAPPPTG